MQDSSNSINGSGDRRQALLLHPNDDVAVALCDVKPGPIEILGTDCGSIVAVEEVCQGHKIAVRPIAAGDAITKYGVAIGFATSPIAAGAWVHTHNCRSGLDERSHTLELHSGAPTDTKYV
jgi:altronate dehydratase small subunit